MFSIIMPLDTDRFELFKITKKVYDAMPQKKEFIIPTRSEVQVKKYLEENGLDKDVRIIPYTLEVGFNCAKALNIGVRNAKYNSIIITCPEILPMTPVLDQLEKVLGTNVICQVWDENSHGDIAISLVNLHYRSESPRMYFLGMFNKTDIEKINGWDEDFTKGYACEDYDFGARWARAGLPFTMREDIEARHQYHPRKETVPDGWIINKRKLRENNKNGVIKCKNGLYTL